MDNFERLIDAVTRLQEVLMDMGIKEGARYIALPQQALHDFDMAVKHCPSFLYSAPVNPVDIKPRSICGVRIVGDRWMPTDAESLNASHAQARKEKPR